MRDNGLGPFLNSATVTDHDGLIVQVLPMLGYLNLRGNPNDSAFVAAVVEIVGQALPIAENTMTIGDHRIYWLGPNEWLIVTPHEGVKRLCEGLRGIKETQVVVTDVSGGNIGFRLSGRGATDVLARGCTLDFDATSFLPGMCAQSGLAKASVLIGQVDSKPVFEIVVRRSFSEYLAIWLQSAGGEFVAGHVSD